MEEFEFTLVFRLLFLVFAPLIIGLAASTALRATIYSAFAFYIVPAITLSWEFLPVLFTPDAARPEQAVVMNALRVLLGSAAAGAVLGLVFYGIKRLFQRTWRRMRPAT